MMNMVKPKGFVDCVSLFCSSDHADAKKKLEILKKGEILEVVFDTKFEVNLLVNDLSLLGYTILQVIPDRAGAYHVLVEKS